MKKLIIRLLQKWLNKLNAAPIEDPEWKDLELSSSELISIQRTLRFKWNHPPQSPYPPYNTVVRRKLMESGMLEEIGKILYDNGMIETDIMRKNDSLIAVVRLFVYKRAKKS